MFYEHQKLSVDAKGRLFIPVKLRERLGETFMLSRGIDKCVNIYPLDEWEKFTERLETLPLTKARDVRRFFYSGAKETSADAQGRVTLSSSYREFASLGKEVYLVGNRGHLEVWSSEAWEAEESRMLQSDIVGELIELGF